WDTARAHGPGVLQSLLQAGWPGDVLINVNFPDCAPDDVAGIEVTAQGARDQRILRAEARTDLRGDPYYWLGFAHKLSDPPAGVDLRAMYEGRISVTPLHVDLTHRETAAALRKHIGGA